MLMNASQRQRWRKSFLSEAGKSDKPLAEGYSRGIVSRWPMILIVDDHADSANALKRLLEHRGMEARCAFSAQEAMEFLRSSKPELVVLDDMMPDASGLDVLRELRNDTELKDLKVVFYSAVFDFDRKQQAERLGINDWMVKGTMKMSDIVDRIASTVQQ